MAHVVYLKVMRDVLERVPDGDDWQEIDWCQVCLVDFQGVPPTVTIFFGLRNSEKISPSLQNRLGDYVYIYTYICLVGDDMKFQTVFVESPLGLSEFFRVLFF